MSLAMNSEASSSMRWSEKPSAPSWDLAWLASSRGAPTEFVEQTAGEFGGHAGPGIGHADLDPLAGRLG